MFSILKNSNFIFNSLLITSTQLFYSTKKDTTKKDTTIKDTTIKTSKDSPKETLLSEYAICKEYLLPLLENSFLYDQEIDQWYQYNLNNSQIWEKIDNEDFKLIIIKHLENHSQIKNNIRMSFLVNVISFLKTLLKSNLRGFSRNNLHLIPFINGVLNLKTSEFLPYSTDIKFASRLNINYNPNAQMNMDFVDWLLFISNGNELFLKVIRNYLFLLLTRNNQYHVALYLHGPAGTGKSLFEKILISIVSQQSTVSTDLRRLKSNFETAKLIDKNLLLLSDIDDAISDVNKLKLIISGDLLAAEKKFQAPFEFFPTCLTLISSNHIWQPSDTSSGIIRRIIYLPFNNIPSARDPEFFYLDPKGYPQGRLAPSLPGFINWILNNPQEQLKLFSKDINLLNEELSPHISKNTNTLLAWATENLSYSKGSFTPTGNKLSSSKTHLYPNYVKFCFFHGFRPISFNKFSYSLMDICINSLGWRDVFKKDVMTGSGLVNIIIETNSSNNNNLKIANKVSRDYFGSFVEGSGLNLTTFKGLFEYFDKYIGKYYFRDNSSIKNKIDVSDELLDIITTNSTTIISTDTQLSHSSNNANDDSNNANNISSNSPPQSINTETISNTDITTDSEPKWVPCKRITVKELAEKFKNDNKSYSKFTYKKKSTNFISKYDYEEADLSDYDDDYEDYREWKNKS